MKTIRYTDEQAEALIASIERIANYKVADRAQLAAHFSDNADMHMDEYGETTFEFQTHETKSGHVETLTIREGDVLFEDDSEGLKETD